MKKSQVVSDTLNLRYQLDIQIKMSGSKLETRASFRSGDGILGSSVHKDTRLDEVT